MAQNAGLAIPSSFFKQVGGSAEAMQKSIETLSKDIRDAIQDSLQSVQTYSEELQDKFMKSKFIQGLQKNIIGPGKKLFSKAKKYMKSALSYLKNISLSLGRDLLNILFKVIGWLALLAFLDPSGSFITSIINMAVDFIGQAINFIGGFLPVLVRTMLDLAPKIIMALLNGLANISSKLSDMFGNFADMFPKDSFVGQLLGFVQWMFSSEGTVGRLISSLQEFTTLLFGGHAGKAFEGLLNNLIDMVFSLISNIIPFLLTALKSGLSLLFAPAFWVGILKSLKKLLLKTLDFLLDAISQWYDMLINGLLKLPGLIMDGVGVLFKKETWIKVASVVGDFFKDVFDKLANYFKSIFISIMSKIPVLGDGRELDIANVRKALELQGAIRKVLKSKAVTKEDGVKRTRQLDFLRKRLGVGRNQQLQELANASGSDFIDKLGKLGDRFELEESIFSAENHQAEVAERLAGITDKLGSIDGSTKKINKKIKEDKPKSEIDILGAYQSGDLEGVAGILGDLVNKIPI